MPAAESRRFRADREGDRLTISFDDGAMNLLSRAALEELALLGGALRSEALTHATPIKVMAFRSSRPGLFAAGADMREMSSFTGQEAGSLARLGQEVFRALAQLPVVTVALIDGDCFGGALDLAMAFDVRLSSPRSRFSHPGSRLGIVTGYGGTSRWRRLLDVPGARALLLGNEVFDAQAALRMGIIDRIAEDFEVELTRIGSLDQGSVTLVKELTTHAPALSQRELALLAERLGSLYGL